MSLVESRRGAAPEPYSGGPSGVDHGPATLDVRLWFPLRWALLIGLLLGMVLASLLTQWLGETNYVADARLLAVNMDTNNPDRGVQIEQDQIQSIFQLARSDAYLIELAHRAGVSTSLDDLHRMIDASRPGQAAIVQIEARGPDQATIDAIAPQLVPTLNVMINRARQGSVAVLDENDRDAFAGINKNYTGPLYVDLFHGQAERSVVGAPVSYNQLAGAVLGVMVMFFLGLAFHARARVHSDEQLDQVFGLRQVATVPRSPWVRRRRSEHHLRGVAVAIDGMSPQGVSSVGLVGSGIPRTRAVLALKVAAGMADSLDRDVVVVDLDVERAALSRRLGLVRRFPRRTVRRGVSDVTFEGYAPETLLRPVPRRKMPRGVRRLVRRDGHKVYALGAGTHVGDRSFGSEPAAVDMIKSLSQQAAVVVVLPRVPGPAPVQGVLDELDACLLTVLDGWTEVEPAQAASSVMHATTMGRDGFLLLEN